MARRGLHWGADTETERERDGERREKEGGSSLETHKPSSLAGAGYNDTQ